MTGGTIGGRFLLAHELAHTIQSSGLDPSAVPSSTLRSTPTRDQAAEREASQSALSVVSGGRARTLTARSAPGSIHLFEASERSQIGSFAALIAATRTIANQHTFMSGEGVPQLDWSGFVEATGGHTATGSAGGVSVQPRYLFTCRCGLIDMRHFFQLAYVSYTLWNRRATEMGRTYELEHEATSLFAPEDTPTNAMGAFFGSEVSKGAGAAEFVTALNDYLRICTPVDFTALAGSDQNIVVDFYAARDAAGVPANQNQTATPASLAVTACGTTPNRSFPFVLESGDPDQKTISSLAQPYSLTGDTEMRDWIFAQSATTLRNLPVFEKIRLVNRLLNGWVSEGDIGAVEQICGSSSASDLTAIRTAIAPRESELNDTQGARLHAALNRSP